jgi:hypothetical protein
MNTVTKRFPGPSRHREMALLDRIALYRRVIGYLRFCEYRKGTLSKRMRFELASATAEASLMTGVPTQEPSEQLHLVRVLLAECLSQQLGREASCLALFEPAKTGTDYQWNR